MADESGLSAAARWRRRHPERLRASRAATNRRQAARRDAFEWAVSCLGYYHWRRHGAEGVLELADFRALAWLGRCADAFS